MTDGLKINGQTEDRQTDWQKKDNLTMKKYFFQLLRPNIDWEPWRRRSPSTWGGALFCNQNKGTQDCEEHT